jgi:hypothetical protein
VIGDNNVLGSDDGLNADSSGNRGLHAIGGADSVLGDAICVMRGEDVQATNN